MNKAITRFIVLAIVFSAFGPLAISQQVSVKRVPWGEVNGKEVALFTLTNISGMKIKVTNYGGTLVSVLAPDKNGTFENVVIGFDSLKQYQETRGQHGRTIGRFANRIGGAQFNLNGTTYKLAANNGPNTLHGGANGFSSRVFEIDSVYSNADSSIVALHYTSADMEEGFPGKLTLQLRYILTGENEVKIDYKAVTDKPTVVNFTNHSYFNLTGEGESILDNLLQIESDYITTMGPDQLPTGQLELVKGTNYDFLERHSIGQNIDSDFRGYDINYKLRNVSKEPSLAATVVDFGSGRVLEAYTTEPGMQLYTRRNSICLEMQHFPDSPHHPNFPSVVLNPEETYRQTTIYKFSVLSRFND